MGIDTLSDGEGYTAFDSGDNAIVKISTITCDLGSYDGDESYQLKFVFDAEEEVDGEEGRIPAWMNSKITIRESDNVTSSLAKFLLEADAVQEVLDSLAEDGVFDGVEDMEPEEVVQGILDKELKFEAETDDENIALGKAVGKALQGKVFRASTDLNSSGEYSKVEKITAQKQEEEDRFDGFEISLYFDHEYDEEGSGSQQQTSESSTDDDSGDDDKEMIFGDEEEGQEA